MSSSGIPSSEAARNGGPIRIGVSACLLGQRVRYDGGHQRDPFLSCELARFVEWVPVCPEAEAGLGTPRPPLRLVRDVEGVRLVEIESGRDHTRTVRAWARRRIAALAGLELCGYVLKKDSPSCGMARVKLHRTRGGPERKGRGLFAEALMQDRTIRGHSVQRSEGRKISMAIRFARRRGLRAALTAAIGLGLAGLAQAGDPVSAEDDSSKPFVVKIHADWCGTCTKLNPTMAELRERQGDKIRYVQLDVTDKEALARSTSEADRLGIREFFDEYKSKTGTVGVLNGASREPVTVLKGELDVAEYESALTKASAGGAS